MSDRGGRERPDPDTDPERRSDADSSSESDAETSASTDECAEDGCHRDATVRLHVPWGENRVVCAAHARVLGRQDGVVADPIDDADADWS